MKTHANCTFFNRFGTPWVTWNSQLFNSSSYCRWCFCQGKIPRKGFQLPAARLTMGTLTCRSETDLFSIAHRYTLYYSMLQWEDGCSNNNNKNRHQQTSNIKQLKSIKQTSLKRQTSLIWLIHRLLQFARRWECWCVLSCAIQALLQPHAIPGDLRLGRLHKWTAETGTMDSQKMLDNGIKWLDRRSII